MGCVEMKIEGFFVEDFIYVCSSKVYQGQKFDNRAETSSISKKYDIADKRNFIGKCKSSKSAVK